VADNPAPTYDLRSAKHRFVLGPDSTAQPDQDKLNRTFVLTGTDLYRLNCQSCHGPEGKGAPPDVSSVIPPVQGTSSVFIKKRMEARGTPIDDEFAGQLSAQAEAALRK
jgi:mono/diheme cytochrome c family protein